jgi:hypothetical protein
VQIGRDHDRRLAPQRAFRKQEPPQEDESETAERAGERPRRQEGEQGSPPLGFLALVALAAALAERSAQVIRHGRDPRESIIPRFSIRSR